MALPEKRKYPRLNFNVVVDYNKLNQKNISGYTSEGVNISAGGIRIILLDQFTIGDTLEVQFMFAGLKTKISAIAKIVWIEKFIIADAQSGPAYEAGLEFINIKPEDQLLINDHVLANIKK